MPPGGRPNVQATPPADGGPPGGPPAREGGHQPGSACLQGRRHSRRHGFPSSWGPAGPAGGLK
eukprot:7246874-Lingulodinium_polyedra.AAC.1